MTRPSLLLFASIIIGVVIADQLTKMYIVQAFTMYESVEVVPGFFNLTYLTNNGAAFSMLAGQPALWRQVFFICTALIALVIVVIAWRSYSRESEFYTISLALVAGGAIGNLIDRVRLGAVVDFLDFYIGSYHWPAFNIADSAIVVGVTFFIVTSIVIERRKKKTQS